MKQKFFLFAFAFLMLSFFSCKKIEEYATITINGVNYSHDSEYFNGIQSPESSTVTVWKDCNVAEYVSKLKPLENGYPSYTLAFYLLLESDNEIKFNQAYKITKQNISEDFLQKYYAAQFETLSSLKESIPDSYNGIAIISEKFLIDYNDFIYLDGELIFERYDDNTGYYWGSYLLSGITKDSNALDIRGSFRTKLIVNNTMF